MGSRPSKTFELDVSRGLTACFAKGNPAPVKTGKIEMAEGIDGGKAVRIPKEGGYLLYKLQDNFPTERGTILLWLKPDWSAEGVYNWNPDFRGIFSTAHDGKTPGPAQLSNGNQLGAVQYGVLHYHWCGEKSALARWEERRVFPAGIWACYAFTYDSQKGLALYRNGIRLQRTNKYMERSLGDADGFYLGSANFYQKLTGFDGSLARAEIYDGILSDEEIRRISWSHLPRGIEVRLNDTVALTAETPTGKTFEFSNWTAAPASGKIRLVIKDASGAKLSESVRNVALKSGETRVESVPVEFPSAGEGVVEAFIDDTPVGRFELFAIDRRPLRESMPYSVDGATRNRLLEVIDCSREAGEEKYRDDGATRVVSSPLGSWRESFGGKKLSGFIYRSSAVRNPARPHWLEIEYPDNMQRQFYVAVFQENNGKTLTNDGTLDTIGVLTGGMHPVTGAMQKKRLLFWPGTKSLTLGCFSHAQYDGDHGPALAKISLYEVEGPLPQLKLNAPENSPGRMLGIWQEDPFMPKAIWFNRTNGSNQNRAFWNEKWNRMAMYLLYTGQNLCPMPVFSYFGDACETEGYMPGWDELGAQVLEREGLGFLPSLQDIGTAAHVVNGAGGLGFAMGMEKISWTLDEALAKGTASLERFANNNDWSANAAGTRQYPRFNPLHPEVQAGYLRIISDYAKRFSRFSGFKGLSFIITDNWSNLFYRNLSEGYEDWSIRQFEKDTGIRVPVSFEARDRFSKRYDYLMKYARNEWINWRAGRLADFYRQMAKTLRKEAPGRKIVIIARSSTDDFCKWPQIPSLKQSWLERGVDFEKIAAIGGFDFAPPSVRPNVERAGINTPLREKGELRNARYHAFSPELSTLSHGSGGAAVLIQSSDFETYNGYAPEQVKSYFLPRDSSSPCHHAFSIPIPNNRYAPENLVRMLADFDPEILLNGWWGCPDNGAIDAFLPFYRAFRTLPRVPLAKVPGISDPVQARYGAGCGKSGDPAYYLLLVNRESYPVEVRFAFNGGIDELRDVIEDRPVTLRNGVLARFMKPYEVICLESASPLALGGVEVKTPPEIVAALKKQLKFLHRVADVLPRKALCSNGLNFVIVQAENALSAGAYSRLHYLFQSHPTVMYLRKMAGKPVFVGIPKAERNGAGSLRLRVLLRNETPERLTAGICAGIASSPPGASRQIEFAPLEARIVELPLPGTPAPFGNIEVEISVTASEKRFTVARQFLAPIAVEAGKWTKEFTLGNGEATFALSRDGGNLLVRARAKDKLRIRGPQIWTSACVEIYADLDPLAGMDSDTPGAFHPECIQIGVPAFESGRVNTVLQMGKLAERDKIAAEISDLPGGYLALVRIPLNQALGGSVDGKNIGFAIAVDRVDGGGVRRVAASAGNEFWRSRAEFVPVHFPSGTPVAGKK